MSYQELVTSSPTVLNNHDPNGFKLIPNRIFVGGMSRETTEEDLLRYFAAYGNVKSAKIITDINTGASKGYGFVTFASEEEALRLQKYGGIAILHNRKLNIGPAIKRNVATVTSTETDPESPNSTPSVSQVAKSTETSESLLNPLLSAPLAAGYPTNGLFAGLDPATAMLYQPFYGFPFSYLYPGSSTFPQFPY